MAYLVRSKHKEFAIREGDLPTDRVLVVTPSGWVRFERLPLAAEQNGDPELEIKVEELPPAREPEDSGHETVKLQLRPEYKGKRGRRR